MPRSKSAASASPKPKAKKAPVKAERRPKKTKAVLVDVIEDDETGEESSWSEAVEIKAEKASVKKASPSEIDQLDSQKKFYSELASEIKKAPKEEKKAESTEKSRRSLGLYRRLAIKFVALVVILAAVVAYFSFSKLTVSVKLKGETINDNLLLKIVDTTQATSTPAAVGGEDPREIIPGTIKEIKTEVQKTYPSTGETYLGEDIVGKVRIINNYNKSQALVATTRLLSADNKLYRIKDAVNVPAGGEVTVDIYADKPSADLAIDPSRFTIPGLWLGLQDKIYARSDEKFTYTQKVKKYVNVSDLERATKDITDSLLASAKAQAGQASDGSNWLYLSDESPDVMIDAKSGSQQDQFTAKASGRIVAINFSKDEAAKLAGAKLNLIVPDDKELIEFKPENISYSLENYDAASKSATVKAEFSGVMALKSDAQVINPQQLVNLSADQISTYLKSQPEIMDFSLSFSPSFIRKAPSLVDRISIVINKD